MEVDPTAVAHTGQGDPTPPTSVDQARARVARAQTDVVRFETDLETLRTNLGLTEDDPYYLGGRVEAAQRRVTAAQTEIDLARARLADARDGNTSPQIARGEMARAQDELDRATADLGRARAAFADAGGSYDADGAPAPGPRFGSRTDAPRSTDASPGPDAGTRTTAPPGTGAETPGTVGGQRAEAAVREWRDNPVIEANPAFTDSPQMSWANAAVAPVSGQVAQYLATALHPRLNASSALPMFTSYLAHRLGVPLPEVLAGFRSTTRSPDRVEQMIREQWALWHRSGALDGALDAIAEYGTPIPWTMRVPPALPWQGNGQEPGSVGMGRARRFADDAEAVTWAETAMPFPRMPDESRRALREYSEEGHSIVNRALRHGEVPVPEGLTQQEAERRATDLIRHIDNGIGRSQLPEPVILDRGVESDFIARLVRDRYGPDADPEDPRAVESLVGTTFVDDGVVSTSVGRYPAALRDAYLLIRAPQGLPVVNLISVAEWTNDERELTVSRGLKYVVHDVYQRKGPSADFEDDLLWVLEVEVVPNSWEPPPGWRPAPLDESTRYWDPPDSDDDMDDASDMSSESDLQVNVATVGAPAATPAPNGRSDGASPESGIRADADGGGRSIEDARAEVARAQTEVVRFETELENTRNALGLAEDDLSYLGGRVEAAQRRVTAAQAETDLAQARLADARGSRTGTETARAEMDRARTELDRAHADLDQARENYARAGGTVTPDGT
ncbi:ADP-ribosyltransferase, partial [Marinitenerispora sediminis]